MLESSAALCPEFGLDTAHCTETSMEKNPSSSASNKVPPRSSSTGPPPGESKAKSGEKSFPIGCHSCPLRCGPPRRPARPSAGGGRPLFIRADVAVKTFELSFGAKANMLTEEPRTNDVHAFTCIWLKTPFGLKMILNVKILYFNDFVGANVWFTRESFPPPSLKVCCLIASV